MAALKFSRKGKQAKPIEVNSQYMVHHHIMLDQQIRDLMLIHVFITKEFDGSAKCHSPMFSTNRPNVASTKRNKNAVFSCFIGSSSSTVLSTMTISIRVSPSMMNYKEGSLVLVRCIL
eukprot:Gregarina_sp_Poly_1__545@NODE_1130_length_4995_cov_340_345373_g781_i0_p3_GENE_NODE_1130_length_4995_cov_340_345373_g781_i0NODE_1130_length_4995_cov_340_345373_g781_i0_p3_ORF_typecomplete_len118_score6_32_NODE_1130_length_4995_cov_340_345373_g781_i022582611